VSVVNQAASTAADAHPQNQQHATKQNSGPAPGRSERGAMSYSEKANGTVAEHEAMQSPVMNRVASGKGYWVKKGQEVNEKNVIEAPRQYQGVTRNKSGFDNYYHGNANDAGAHNAVQADQNLMRTGKPTNDGTSFVVHHDGSAPSDEDIFAMGHVVPAKPPRVGSVYLYKPAPGR
jgi:hypothetical protein